MERVHRELTRAKRRKSSTLCELLGYANAVRVISGTGVGCGDSWRSWATRRRPRPSSARASSQRADADSGELELFEAFLDIIRTAAEAGFDVIFRWVPREQLVDARRALQVQ